MEPLTIRFTFLQTGETALAMLLERDAPQTCRAVLNSLPVAGVAHHAAYSGSEAVLVLPDRLRVPPEHATYNVFTGDVGFTWFAAGSAHGVAKEFAELCWFYDADARPSMHEGPCAVSIFARLSGDTHAFYARCRAMRRTGVTGLLVDRVGPGDVPGVVFHDPRREAELRPRAVVWGQSTVALGYVADTCVTLRSAAHAEGLRVGSAIGEGRSGSIGQAANGRLVALIGDDAPAELRAAVSDDGGATWTPAVPTGLVGAHPALATDSAGRVVAVYETARGIDGAVLLGHDAGWASFGVAADANARRPVALPIADGRLACSYQIGAPGTNGIAVVGASTIAASEPHTERSPD